MNTLRKLCEGQNRNTRRKIVAAYYQGAAEALRLGPKTDTRLPAFLKRQAD